MLKYEIKGDGPSFVSLRIAIHDTERMYRYSHPHVTMLVMARHIERGNFGNCDRTFTWHSPIGFEIHRIIDVVMDPFGNLPTRLTF